MKAISLWQPYASLAVLGIKPYETRSKKPPESVIGTRIAIHAAAKPIHLAIKGLSPTTTETMVRRLVMRGIVVPFAPSVGLPLGAVVGTAVLAEAVQIDYAGWFTVGDGVQLRYPDVFGDYRPGRWVWRLENPIAFTQSVPWKGRQYWFDVDDEVLGRVA